MKTDDPRENTLKVKTTFYGGLEHFFKKKEADIDLRYAEDVSSLLEYLCVSNECRVKIFDDSGNLQPNITILRNGRNIIFQNDLKTKLNGGDTIAIFPPVAGG